MSCASSIPSPNLAHKGSSAGEVTKTTAAFSQPTTKILLPGDVVDLVAQFGTANALGAMRRVCKYWRHTITNDTAAAVTLRQCPSVAQRACLDLGLRPKVPLLPADVASQVDLAGLVGRYLSPVPSQSLVVSEGLVITRQRGRTNFDVTASCFSACGNYLALALSPQSVLRIVNVGDYSRRDIPLQGEPKKLTFAPDLSMLAAQMPNNETLIYSLPEGQVLYKLVDESIHSSLKYVSMSFAPESAQFLARTFFYQLTWQLDGGNASVGECQEIHAQVTNRPPHPDRWSLAAPFCSPGGRYSISLVDFNAIKVSPGTLSFGKVTDTWNPKLPSYDLPIYRSPQDYSQVCTMANENDAVFSPDGQFMALPRLHIGNRRCVAVWRLPDDRRPGVELVGIQEFESNVYQITLMAGGNNGLVFCGFGMEPLQSCTDNYPCEVYQLDYSPPGTHPQLVFQGSHGAPLFSPRGDHLAEISLDPVTKLRVVRLRKVTPKTGMCTML